MRPIGGCPSVRLGIGDLIVNRKTKEMGILLQKHKVLANTPPDQEPDERWFWAWRIKWSKAGQKTGNKWVDQLDKTRPEETIISDIMEGIVEHYSAE